MPAKKGTVVGMSIWPTTLQDIHYLKAKLNEPAFIRKTRKSKRVKADSNPAVIDLCVKSYIRRFKGKGLPFGE